MDVTEDHSSIDKNREKVFDLVLQEELLHNHLNFDEPKFTFNEINDEIYNTEPQVSKEKKCLLKDSFWEMDLQEFISIILE